MKLTEMVKLAGAGYKPAEIRELAEIANEHPEALELAEKLKFDEVKDLIALASEAGADPDPKPEEPAKEKPDNGESDRAAALMQENEELKKQLQAARDANTRRDVSGQTPDPFKEAEDRVFAFINSL